MARQAFISFRDDEIKQLLEDFCAQTNRDVPHTLKAIVRLFFADGFDMAELRLAQGVWRVDPVDLEQFLAGRAAVREAHKASRREKAGRKQAKGA